MPSPFTTAPASPMQNRPLIPILALVLACFLLPACSEEPGPAASSDSVIHTYTIRGQIVSLPSADDPASELRIRHEAIHDFKNADSEPDPMDAMTMSFPPGPDVSLDDLAVGDPIEFVFEMQWAPATQMSATAIKKLPADTQLVFEKAHAPGDHSHDNHHNHKDHTSHEGH